MDEQLAQVEAWANHTKSISDFRLSIRAAVRGLWNGEFAIAFIFIDSMRAAIERNFRKAWRDGASTCGVKEDELTDAEIAEREQIINRQFPYLVDFAREIEENSKANGGLLGPLLDRAELWVLRYEEVKN